MTTALTASNSNTVTQSSLGEMSVQAIVDRKRKLLEVMQAVMKEGEHYGRIPGCGDKPTLYKAGAEILATVFGLAPTFTITEATFAGSHREYRVVCTLTHIASGKSLGEGVGVCSTMESKYRWRRGERKCPECGKAGTVIKGKADYGGGWLCFGKKGGCGQKWPDGATDIEGQSTDRVENPDVADTYNTVLKMAKKRAQVDATLTAVGASDILTQDIEDFPASNHDAVDVEFTEVKAPPPSETDPFAKIDKAKTIAELESLAPALKKLPEPRREEARQRYARRKQLITEGLPQ